MSTAPVDRDALASAYFEALPYEPYPVQEEALLAWFTCEGGVLVSAPTGTGKTLIAEAALFEALHTGQQAYYTTPLIALTEQKYREMCEAAERWGFSADDVGLVTGNRRINPDARILVVVAEILFNRLLRPDMFDFSSVSAVVMDEFHSFNDPQRGIVWEFSLGLLPEHVRTLLLSATVGNAFEFTRWLSHRHKRKVTLVESDERKVPLTFQWIGDELLGECIERLAGVGRSEPAFTPALVFCFNRDECWSVAEQLKGKTLLEPDRRKQLMAALDEYDFSGGAGPKLRQVLMRGIGVHHAGILPHYKRVVESLFQEKLLAVTICTETLSAGINLPARSVLLPGLLKGPPGKKKLIDASSAHQIFGRAGRPQYDDHGYVFALAHEDDVKILRWREKYDAIPSDTKDPGLRKAKKALKKKMPTRKSTQQYWSEAQFNQVQEAGAARLQSRGGLPWRLLAYMLEASPDVQLIRDLIGKRLLNEKQMRDAELQLTRMLITLWTAGYVQLEPRPPADGDEPDQGPDEAGEPRPAYLPREAHPTDRLPLLLHLRGVNPLFGHFLVNQLGLADRTERLLALESLLEMPGSVARHLRVPRQDELPPGPLATGRLDAMLLQRGLATAQELGAEEIERDDSPWGDDERVWVLTLAEKLRRLFDADFPYVHDVTTTPVWCAGELLEYGGDFEKFIASKRLQKHEGIVFRHLLRLILLVAEFQPLCPPETTEEEWREDLDDIQRGLVEACREVDRTSTEKTLEQAEAVDETV